MRLLGLVCVWHSGVYLCVLYAGCAWCRWHTVLDAKSPNLSEGLLPHCSRSSSFKLALKDEKLNIQ